MLSFCIIIHSIYGSQLSLHGHLTIMDSQKKVLTVSVLERDDCIASRPNDSSKEEKDQSLSGYLLITYYKEKKSCIILKCT